MSTLSGRIPVVIVGYRNSDDFARCLDALAAAAPEPAFDVFVCENGGKAAFDDLVRVLTGEAGPCEEDSSSDGAASIASSDMLIEARRLKLRRRDSHVWLVCAAYNLGYAGAINAILAQLRRRPDWPGLWILNPDTIPDSLALAKLVERAVVGNKGLVGSTVVARDKPERVAVRAGHHWLPLTCRTITIGLWERSDAPVDVAAIESTLDGISGASMFITRDCLEGIGPMDERFFLYYEDLDWGLRAKRFGLGYAAASIVRHKGGTTLGSASIHRANKSWLAIYLEHRNRIHFTRKHFPHLIVVSHFFCLLHAVRYLIGGTVSDFRAALDGWLAGVKGEYGPPVHASAQIEGKPRPAVSRGSRWRVKLALSALYWVGIAAADAGRQLFGLAPFNRLTILYYHAVPSDFRFEFERQMAVLSRRATVVPANHRGPLASNAKNVAITFDDAFSSVAEQAIEALAARSFPSTIFAPAGLIGKAPDWNVEDTGATYRETVMTSEQLRAISSPLTTIGSHSMFHKHLTQLSDASLRSEVEDSRAQLERITGAPVTLIAAPYGDVDERVRRACEKAGYEALFSTVAENVDPTDAKTLRGRVRVDPWDGPLEFFLKFNGAYAWLPTIPRFFKSSRGAR